MWITETYVSAGSQRFAACQPNRALCDRHHMHFGLELQGLSALWFPLAFFLLLCLAAPAEATPCMIVTLTGTQGEPPAFNGLAGLLGSNEALRAADRAWWQGETGTSVQKLQKALHARARA